MSDLPSFRPRAALGYVQGNQVVAAPEFLRYLDELARRTGSNTATAESAELTAMVSVPGVGFSDDFAPVSVPTPGAADFGIIPVCAQTDTRFDPV